jgi:hypothetical protein
MIFPFFTLELSNKGCVDCGLGCGYEKNGSDGRGGESIAISLKYAFSSVKALLCSGRHSDLPFPFNALKNGRLRSADLEMNLFRAATQPFNF